MVCSAYLQYCFIHVLHPSIRRKTVLESHFQHISIFRLGVQALFLIRVPPAASARHTCFSHAAVTM